MTVDSATHSPTATRRRRQIADAARAELMDKGVEGLRMRAIADRVGINVATLDYHAGGKDGLIELVAQSIVEDFKAMAARDKRTGLTGREQLVQELRFFREMRLAHPDIHHVMASLSRRAPSDPNIARHIRPMRQGWVDRVAGILEAGRTDGSLRPEIDTDAGAHIVIFTLLAKGAPDQISENFIPVAAELVRAFAADAARDYKDAFK